MKAARSPGVPVPPVPAVARTACWAVVAISATVLVGWWTPLHELRSIGADGPATVPLTALALTALAVATAFAPTLTLRRTAAGLALAAGLLGALAYLGEFDAVVDRLLIPAADRAASPGAGHMAPHTGLAVTALALALLLPARHTAAITTLRGAALLIVAVTAAGHLAGADPLYLSSGGTGVAAPTAVALGILSLAGLALRVSRPTLTVALPPVLFLIAALASALTVATVARHEDRDHRADVRSAAAGTAGVVQTRATHALELLEALAVGSGTRSAPAAQAAFPDLSRPVLDASITNTGLALRVPPSGRTAVARRYGVRVRGSDGRAVRGRRESWILIAAGGVTGPAPLRGLDLADDPARRPLIAAAVRLGTPRITAPMPLFGPDEPVVVAFAPAYRRGRRPASPDGRAAAASAMVVGVLRPRALVDGVRRELRAGAGVVVADGAQPIATHGRLGSDTARRTVDVGGRPWTVTVSLAAPASSVPLLALAATLITLLITALATIATRRDRFARSMVAAREHERDLSEAALVASEERFRTLAQHTRDMISRHDLDGVAIDVSPASHGVLGLPPEAVIGTFAGDACHPEDRAEVLRALARARVREGGLTRYRLPSGDGWRWLETSVNPVVDEPTGTVTEIVASTRDVTDRVEAEEALRGSERRWQSVFELAPTGMATTDEAGRLTSVNPAFAALTGRPTDALLGTPLTDLVAPGSAKLDLAAVIAAGMRSTDAEIALLHAGGLQRRVHVHVVVPQGADRATSAAIIQVIDVDDQRTLEARLRDLAAHDAVTGLLNRRAFEEALRATSEHGHAATLVMLDLDHFKFVNDSLGHAAGDDLLRRVADLLRRRTRDRDLVARLGGDEFAVLVDGDLSAGEAVAATLAEALRALRTPMRPGGQRQVTGSFGVATLVAGDPHAAEEALVAADLAMYEAKDAGRDTYRLYEPGAQAALRMHARVGWEQRVRRALSGHGFQLLLQPIVDLAGPEPHVIGHEALLRLADEHGDLAPPIAFLPIAERLGLMPRIDRWVLARAIGELAAHPDLRLAVNLSPQGLADPGLADHVAELLSRDGVRAERLTIEVTETAALADLSTARSTATELDALGCAIAIDDFGSGYATLSSLRVLPARTVKIDADFVRGCAASDRDRQLVRAMVDLATRLGLDTVAEGVEDAETAQLMRRLGVTRAQGYHFGRPAPVEHWVRQARARP